MRSVFQNLSGLSVVIIVPIEDMIIPLEKKALSAGAILKNATVKKTEDLITRRSLPIIPEKVVLAKSIILRNDTAAAREGLIKKRSLSITAEKTGDKQPDTSCCLFVARPLFCFELLRIFKRIVR